jgi:hypothetical protein
MLKSGLIIGAAMLVLGTTFGFLFPLCVSCLAVFAGVGAGYLSGVFDKPADQGGSAKVGAGAGAIGGVGALVGQVIGGMASAAIQGPQAGAEILRQLGVPVDASATSPAGFYTGAFISTCCFGLVAVALMAGLGALGGLLWYQRTAPKPPTLPA